MRSHAMNARLPLVAALTVGLVAALLPTTDARAQQSAKAVPASQIQVGEDVPLRPDDPRLTRGRDGAGVAVNPNDANHIVMVNADLYHHTCEFHTSRDGGASWTSGTLTAPEGFGAPAGSGAAPCSAIGHGTSSIMGSHAVTFGSGENVYAAFSSAREGEELSLLVAHSDNGGDSFSTAQVAISGEAINVTHRLPGVVALARSGQPDRLVVVAQDSTSTEGAPTPRAAVAAVSEDGGQTWSDRVRVSDADKQAQEIIVTQDPAGQVYVSYRTREDESTGHEDTVPEGAIRVARSDDGLTWQDTHAVDVYGYVEPADSPQFAGSVFAGSNYPRSAAGPDGSVYVVYMEGPPVDTYPVPQGVEQQDHFIHPDAEIKIIRSSDGGQTWSAPVTVNDTAPASDGNIWHQVRHPDVVVAPNGRVDVVWQDRRHWYRGCQHTHAACNEGRYGDTYWAHSTDGGQTFSADVRVSDRTQNNEVGSDYRQGVYWTYSPVAVPLGNNDLFVAWMDSRQGSFETDALDIYYSRIDLNASGAIPVRSVPSSGSAQQSIALARHAYPGGSEATLTATFATEPWSRVVVVNENDPAAALVGGVLARAYMAPVLATPAGGLTSALGAEVDRLDPVGSFVLGGTDAVGAQVASQLEQRIGAEPVRFSGTPAEMAAAVANELDWRGEDQYARPLDAPAFEAAVIANPATGEGVTAAALAANRRLPVLFVDSDGVPAATSQAITDLGIENTLVVGDASSISEAVLADLPSPTRLDGTTMADTSQAVAQEALGRGLPANIVFVTDDDPMSAALAGAAAGRVSALHLVTSGADTSAATSAVGELGVADTVDRMIVLGGLLERTALSWACPAGVVPGSGFVDTSGNVHTAAIECASWYAITAGGPGGLPADRYGPGQSVRRDQMASFITRMIDHAKPGLLPAASGPNPFPGDLSEGNAHYDAIRRLAAAGIVQGGPGGAPADAYGPGQGVRRDQMASFIRRALDEVTLDERARIVTDAAPFSDAAPTHLDNVNALASEGIVVGVGEGEYAGGRSVRRDQMASFVNRGLDYLVQHEEALRPVLTAR